MTTYTESEKSLDVAFSFVANFLSYSLEKIGIRWEMTKTIKYKRLAQRLLFVPEDSLVSPQLIMELADSSMKLRRDLRATFYAEVTNHGSYILYEMKDFQEFVRKFTRKNFESRNICKMFFRYCAFMIEMAIYCIQEDHKDYIPLLVWEIEGVLKNHMKMKKIKDFSLDTLIHHILNRYGEVEMDMS